MLDWLIDFSIHLSIDFSLDWLIDFFIHLSIDCLIDWLIFVSIYRWTGWFFIFFSIDWLIDWLIDFKIVHDGTVFCPVKKKQHLMARPLYYISNFTYLVRVSRQLIYYHVYNLSNILGMDGARSRLELMVTEWVRMTRFFMLHASLLGSLQTVFYMGWNWSAKLSLPHSPLVLLSGSVPWFDWVQTDSCCLLVAGRMGILEI